MTIGTLGQLYRTVTSQRHIVVVVNVFLKYADQWFNYHRGNEPN